MKKKITHFLGFSFSSRVNFFLFLQITAGLTFALLSIVFFLKLTHEVLENDTLPLDTFINHLAVEMRHPLLTPIMTFITSMGGEIFIGTAVIITILTLLYKNHRKDALVFTFILTSGIGLNLLLKSTFQRARPDIMPLFIEPTFSFPSGHAMNSFIFYACLSYFVFLKMKNKRLSYMLISTSILLVMLIGISRIYLGVHFITDVMAGFAAGLFWFVIVLLFEKSVKFFRLFKAYELEKKY